MARLPKRQEVSESPGANASFSIPDALVVVSSEGGITAFNADALRLRLLPPGTRPPAPLRVLPEGLVGLVSEACRTGRPVEGHLWTPEPGVDGASVGTCRVDLLLIPSAPPAQPGCVLQVRPAPSRISGGVSPADLRLERLASIGALLPGMAHEIKNSLVAVKTLTGLLLERDPGLQMAHIVAQEVERISSVVSQMIHYTRPVTPTFAPLDLHPLLQDLLRRVAPQVESRGIRLEQALDANHDRVLGDRYQIDQAVLNLILNAMEAIPQSGGRLAIRTTTRSSPPSIAVAVQDSGCGIPAADLDRLFDDFFTTKQGGTGLGLPITRRIMTAHQGTIEVQSSPGEGTIFELVFPLLEEAPPPASDLP
jgi:signal transduction histidine kinase